jgi:hypothetical protein
MVAGKRRVPLPPARMMPFIKTLGACANRQFPGTAI